MRQQAWSFVVESFGRRWRNSALILGSVGCWTLAACATATGARTRLAPPAAAAERAPAPGFDGAFASAARVVGLPQDDTEVVDDGISALLLRAHFAGIQYDLDDDPEAPAPTELDWGVGIGGSVEVHSGMGAIEGSYFHSEHDDLREGGRAEVHQMSFLGFVGETFRPSDNVAFLPRVGLGAGAVLFDYVGNDVEDELAAQAVVAFEFGLYFWRRLELHVGGRFGCIGWPGDTYAVGSVLTVGGGVVF